MRSIKRLRLSHPFTLSPSHLFVFGTKLSGESLTASTPPFRLLFVLRMFFADSVAVQKPGTPVREKFDGKIDFFPILRIK